MYCTSIILLYQKILTASSENYCFFRKKRVLINCNTKIAVSYRIAHEYGHVRFLTTLFDIRDSH